jgi:hypothetical protein
MALAGDLRVEEGRAKTLVVSSETLLLEEVMLLVEAKTL